MSSQLKQARPAVPGIPVLLCVSAPSAVCLWCRSSLNLHYLPFRSRFIAGINGSHGFQILLAFTFAPFACLQTGDVMLLRSANAVAAIADRRQRILQRRLVFPMLSQKKPST